ncbi:MAG TPA: site-specific integrase [Armatimonadota bacterium]|nr:site-specific integrase [Armatimonadota bacterium]
MSTHELTPSNAVQSLTERAQDYAESSKAESTRRAYQADWHDFTAWAAWRKLPSLPADPSTVALYLTALAEAGKRASTLQRRRAAIAFAHELAGYEPPTRTALVEEVMAGIRREIGVAQQGKAPALTPDIRAMVNHLPTDLRGVRDRALLLIGFAGAFRRSELIALDIEDVEECDEGLRITIRHSKTDQEGKGRLVGIPRGEHPETCPVRAYQSWLHASMISHGPLFRGISTHGKVLGRLSDRGVARTVKRAAEAAGLDPEQYSGHSLRAGLATSAAIAGVLDRDIMAQTGHKRVETLYKYIRRGNLFRDNAAGKVGL